ncbi:MAG: site-specific integrase [Tannerella sp.]|jgi:site-specific recombinase XerD|nr:site-specific integrase [Tannerella sp.]
MRQTFSTLIKDFTDNLDIRPNSRDLYRRNLNAFAKWVVCSGRNIKALKRADILAYKNDLTNQCKSENTIESRLTTLRLFYDWCETIGEHENIAAAIRVRRKERSYRKGHLSAVQVTHLLNSIDQSSIKGLRDFAIINLMLRSGFRCVEVSRLRVCDIHRNDSGCYAMIQRKGANDRNKRIGLTEKILNPVFDYLQYRGVEDESESVFMSHGYNGEKPITAKGIGVIVTKHLKSAGLYSKTITAHSLRHTAAVLMILNQVPIKEVQVMLGHRSTETTEIYLKSVEDEMRLINPAARALDNIF